MAVFGAVIGAVIGGAAGAISSYANTKKQSGAYKKAADSVRSAMEKYSGDAAYNKIRQAGEQEARLQNTNNLAKLSRVSQDNPLKVANFQNAANNISNYDQTAANSEGRERESNLLNALYNKETAHAQNLLKQAKIDAKAQQQAIQAGFNTVGGVADVYNQLMPSINNNNNNSDSTSDENEKTDINNDSGLPASDIEDSLRQLETVSYKYKDPSVDGCDSENHDSGFTAQSAEKTPLFNDAVQTGDDGIKRIDNWKLQEALTAGIAQLQREIDELENNKSASDERLKTFYNSSRGKRYAK